MSFPPGILLALRRALLAGLALVAVLPAARHTTDWLGWLPLWLVVMPGVALWVAEGLPLPRWVLVRPPRRRLQAVRVARVRH